MNYYLAVNGKPEGPMSVDELRSRGITPQSLVWNETMKDWTPAGQVPEIANAIFAASGVPPTPQSDIRKTVYKQESSYQQPQQPYQQPSYQQPQQQPYRQQYQQQPYCDMPPMPTTYLVWAILETILCCLPCGIVGIVYASKVESLYNQGRYDESLRASNTAKNWLIGGLIASVVFFILYIVFYMSVLAAFL